MNLNLHWICPAPSPYNDYLFGRLSRTPGIRLQVHYVRSDLASHPWQSRPGADFSQRTILNRWALDPLLMRLALQPENGFVVAGFHQPGLVLLIAWLTLLKRSFLFWTDTPNLQRPRGFIKKIVRNGVVRLMFHGARRVMGTGCPGVEALEMMGCPRQKLAVLPFVVDLDALRRPVPDPASAALPSPLVLVSSGRLSNRVKGIDLALAALAQARDRSGNQNFVYHIAGVGEDEENLRRQVRELNLNSQVTFHGWMECSSLYELLHRAQVFLHPALYDPFPVAVLEAMAAGLAVCGSDAAGSVRDRVRHGENGFIHRAGDVPALSQHIEVLLRQPERALEIGRRARATAEEWPVARAVATIKDCFGLGAAGRSPEAPAP